MFQAGIAVHFLLYRRHTEGIRESGGTRVVGVADRGRGGENGQEWTAVCRCCCCRSRIVVVIVAGRTKYIREGEFYGGRLVVERRTGSGGTVSQGRCRRAVFRLRLFQFPHRVATGSICFVLGILIRHFDPLMYV